MTLTAIKPQEIPVKIKSKNCTLKYDLNAFANIEQLLGSIPKAFELLNNFNESVIKIFIWAGLLHQENKISLEKIEKMSLDSGVVALISEALKVSLSEDYDFFEEWDWALLYYTATVTLNMSEKDFWKATPRKIISLLKVVSEVKEMDTFQKDKQPLANDKAIAEFMRW